MKPANKTGILFINLGTPKDVSKRAVWTYLSEFLNDPRVIDLPIILRKCLLYGLILPLRIAKTTRAYRAIWTKEGSPLRVHSNSFMQKIQKAFSLHFGTQVRTCLAMRYGNPSIASQISELRKDCDHLWIWPLYPQYAASAGGTAIAAALRHLEKQWDLPKISVVRDFYKEPAFIKALAALYASSLHAFQADHLLFSYHGLPERHVIKSGCVDVETSCSGKACSIINRAHLGCYRAQCYETTRALVKALDLNEAQYTVSFQSRLGKLPWIGPYTDVVLREFRAKGIKRLAVACPSFVVDCLETLEEIGIRAREQWKKLGGEELLLLPSLNAEDLWIETVVEMLASMDPLLNRNTA